MNTAPDLNAIMRTRWVATENDVIGGWCVQVLGDVPLSEGGIAVADFISRETAEHIAKLHNFGLALETGVQTALEGAAFQDSFDLRADGSCSSRRLAAEAATPSSQDRAPRSAFGRLVRAARRTLLRGGGGVRG